jgi:hypothetical protein
MRIHYDKISYTSSSRAYSMVHTSYKQKYKNYTTLTWSIKREVFDMYFHKNGSIPKI